MQKFSYEYSVRAPLKAVAEFHQDTRALRRLTPPPIIVLFQRLDPLGENSVSEFTMWFGPFPVRWIALHSNYDPLTGFTDTQTHGPLRFWRHTHRFEAMDSRSTRIREHIEFDYYGGLRWLWTRIIYSKPGLQFLFFYRKTLTRRILEKGH
jgi:ligand-binding SRPBCC domain-containing protein